MGRVRRLEYICPNVAELYRVTFAPDLPTLADGDPLPIGWEGLYFGFDTAMSGLRPDGTPEEDVLPHIDLPRRMYAGERTEFAAPIIVGTTVEQSVRAGQVVEKSGRAGRLVFADIERTYLVDREPAVESTWHDVFLEQASTSGGPRPLAEQPEHTYSFTPDSRHLFRFSALTFNTHRVHYDRQWARTVEGLDDLLVHGPLTRILLADTANRAARDSGDDFNPALMEFTATAPLFVDRAITLGATRTPTGWSAVAVDSTGAVAAVAQFTNCHPHRR